MLIIKGGGMISEEIIVLIHEIRDDQEHAFSDARFIVHRTTSVSGTSYTYMYVCMYNMYLIFEFKLYHAVHEFL